MPEGRGLRRRELMKEIKAVCQAILDVTPTINWTRVYVSTDATYRFAYGLLSSPGGKPLGVVRISEISEAKPPLMACITVRSAGKVQKYRFEVSEFPTAQVKLDAALQQGENRGSR